jgi:hypothetical protein
LLLMVIVWPIYTGFAAMLGLYCSAVTRSALAAALKTAIVFVGWTVLHWLWWSVYGPPTLFIEELDSPGRWAHQTLLTLPFQIWFVGPAEYRSLTMLPGRTTAFIIHSLLAIALLFLATAALDAAALGCLRRMRSGHVGIIGKLRLFVMRPATQYHSAKIEAPEAFAKWGP